MGGDVMKLAYMQSFCPLPPPSEHRVSWVRQLQAFHVRLLQQIVLAGPDSTQVVVKHGSQPLN